jgi:hypothetical protein
MLERRKGEGDVGVLLSQRVRQMEDELAAALEREKRRRGAKQRKQAARAALQEGETDE